MPLRDMCQRGMARQPIRSCRIPELAIPLLATYWTCMHHRKQRCCQLWASLGEGLQQAGELGLQVQRGVVREAGGEIPGGGRAAADIAQQPHGAAGAT